MRKATLLILLTFLASLLLPAAAAAQGTGGWSKSSKVNAPICTAADLQIQPAIASDGSGGAIIVWKDWRNIETSSFDIYAQRVDSTGAAQWTADGVSVCTADRAQENPAICGDGQGGAIIAWGGPGWELRAQRMDSAGAPQWATEGVLVCATASIGSPPVMLSDGSGGAFIAWSDRRNDSGDSAIYAQRVSPAGALQWGAEGVAVCAAPDSRGGIVMVSDGSGGIVVAWNDCRSESLVGPHCGDVYAQRIDSSGVPLWTTDGVPICTAPYSQGWCAIIGDGHGGATIVWRDDRNTDPSERYYITDIDIYAQKIDGAGVPQWAPDGVAICTAPHYQFRPVMVSDGNGGAIIAWSDSRSYDPTEDKGAYDVYAQRIDSEGNPQWSADGVVLCTEHGYSPEIVSDGSSGAVLCWQDSRNSNVADRNSNDLDVKFFINDDVYAQRVNAGGEPQWGSNGAAICTDKNPQILPCMVSDGTGGAIMVWVDYRNGEGSGESDIYAQRIASSGVLGSGGATKGGGLPLWAWIAIGAGAVAVGGTSFFVWRRMVRAKGASNTSSQS